jgi:hypothetical protein
MHLIERQSHFSPQHGSFDAWAYMVAKHKLIDILRAETRRPDKAYGHQVEPYDGASDDATAGWTDGGSEGHFIERSSIRSETHSDLEGLVISLEDIDLLRSHVRSALGRVSAVSVRAWHQFIPMPTWRSWLIEGDFPLDFPDWDFPTLTRAEQLSLLESITGRPRNTLIQALNRAMKVLEQTSFARKLRELE